MYMSRIFFRQIFIWKVYTDIGESHFYEVEGSVGRVDGLFAAPAPGACNDERGVAPRGLQPLNTAKHRQRAALSIRSARSVATHVPTTIILQGIEC
jgi:hypothetical protein